MASRLEAGVRPEPPRLRRVLRHPQRRRRLLHAPRLGRPHRRARRRRRAGSVGEPDADRARRLSDRPAVGQGGRDHRPAAHQAVLPQPAVHRAALAVGRAGRRGDRPHRSRPRPDDRRRLAEDLRLDDEEHGRRHRPRAEGARAREARARHARDLHQRQRRRALLVQLAVLVSEDVSVRGGHARAGDRPLARHHSRRSGDRAGGDHDGLDRDDSRGHGHGAGSRVSARRREPAAGLHRRARRPRPRAVLAHHRLRRRARRPVEVPQGPRRRIPVRSVVGSGRESEREARPPRDLRAREAAVPHLELPDAGDAEPDEHHCRTLREARARRRAARRRLCRRVLRPRRMEDGGGAAEDAGEGDRRRGRASDRRHPRLVRRRPPRRTGAAAPRLCEAAARGLCARACGCSKASS